MADIQLTLRPAPGPMPAPTPAHQPSTVHIVQGLLRCIQQQENSATLYILCYKSSKKDLCPWAWCVLSTPPC